MLLNYNKKYLYCFMGARWIKVLHIFFQCHSGKSYRLSHTLMQVFVRSGRTSIIFYIFAIPLKPNLN